MSRVRLYRLNEAGVEYWLGMLKPYVNDGPVQKRSIIQMHTKITTFIAVALFIQFLKIVRQKAMPIHRWLGRSTITVALLATPGFASLIYGLPHPVAQYAEYPIIVGIPYFGLKGWKEIREKKIQDHKASMIMFSACFFYFGVQRLMLMAMGVLHSGPWAEYMPLGPWKDWTAESTTPSLASRSHSPASLPLGAQCTRHTWSQMIQEAMNNFD